MVDEVIRALRDGEAFRHLRPVEHRRRDRLDRHLCVCGVAGILSLDPGGLAERPRPDRDARRAASSAAPTTAGLLLDGPVAHARTAAGDRRPRARPTARPQREQRRACGAQRRDLRPPRALAAQLRGRGHALATRSDTGAARPPLRGTRTWLRARPARHVRARAVGRPRAPARCWRATRSASSRCSSTAPRGGSRSPPSCARCCA